MSFHSDNNDKIFLIMNIDNDLLSVNNENSCNIVIFNVFLNFGGVKTCLCSPKGQLISYE